MPALIPTFNFACSLPCASLLKILVGRIFGPFFSPYLLLSTPPLNFYFFSGGAGRAFGQISCGVSPTLSGATILGMNNHFISFVRILYTSVLVLFGLALVPYYVVMISASQNGHGSFSFLSTQGIVPALLFGLLLVSRIMYARSPKWLLLGSPTILAIVGVIGYLVYAELFLIPSF